MPHGEAGELIVRGDSAADGYWNQRAKTRRTFQGEWTYTGDTYTRDADGYFRFQGRSDEMLKVSGVWVSPFEVEEALISHPAVLEAAVIGRQRPRRPDQAQGVRHSARRRPIGHRSPGNRIAGAREGAHRRLEIPALDRVRRKPAEDRHRQDPALPAAGGMMRAGTIRLPGGTLETAWWGPAADRGADTGAAA